MRALWLVDVKWIAGLLAWLLVVAAGVLVSLERITEHDTAQPLASAFIAIGISDRVSDDDYSKIEAAAAADPNTRVALTPVASAVSGREITGLTKDQASLLVAG